MPEGKHFDCLKDLGEAQDAEKDNRDMVREADHFLNKRDGQWEPKVLSTWSGRPRYTFDECNPIVDDIMGEMESMDFDINVDPSGGEASKDLANAYEGIIRNIENISKARFIYNASGRIMVGTGMNGWRVVTEYRDGDSFQQDLLIKSIPSFEDSVWFDPDSTEQDASDAMKCWVLTSMSIPKFKKRFPKASETSVSTSKDAQAYSFKKKHEIIIGEYLYRKKKTRQLGLLSDGRVVVIDDKFRMIQDELKAAGIVLEDVRTRPYYVVYQRLFNGDDWLDDEKKTVFSYIPVVPVYGNFRISENKVIYWGAIEKLMDAQRVINYATSRIVEEGALAPKPKTWMTEDQAKSPNVRKGLRTMNTNNDPVQFYDHVEGVAPPYQAGPPGPNTGLITTVETSMNFVQRSSGTYDEARGTAPAQRSGEAIDKLQQKSDNPKRKWFTAMEVALTHTARILIKAIPKVYDTTQEMQLVNPDKTTDTIVIKQKVVDQKSGNVVEINDLSKGKYGVVVKAGPAFQSRQQETVEAINDVATIDPSIITMGADVLLNNIPAPGIDQIAERKRAQMVKAGIIPENQLTEEEKVKVAQAQGQAQEPDAMMVAAKAEMIKAQTEAESTAMKLELEQSRIALKKMELQMKGQTEQSKTMIESIKAINQQIKLQADTLKAIREAMGVDAVVSPTTAAAYEEQARDLLTTVQTN